MHEKMQRTLPVEHVLEVSERSVEIAAQTSATVQDDLTQRAVVAGIAVLRPDPRHIIAPEAVVAEAAGLAA
jgi:hypothetical protein